MSSAREMRADTKETSQTKISTAGSRVLDVDPSRAGFIWRKQKIFAPLAGLAALCIIIVGCVLAVFYGVSPDSQSTATNSSLNVSTGNTTASPPSFQEGARIGRMFMPQLDTQDEEPIEDTQDFDSMMNDLSNVMSNAFDTISSAMEEEQKRREKELDLLDETMPQFSGELLDPIIIVQPEEVKVPIAVLPTTKATTTTKPTTLSATTVPTTTTKKPEEEDSGFLGLNFDALFPNPEEPAIPIQPPTAPPQPVYRSATTYPFQSYHRWASDDLTWSLGNQFCTSQGRRLCSAREICGKGIPVVTGPLTGTRWTPTSDIANSWLQVGQDAYYMTCWEYTFVRQAFPYWGETTQHAEWKHDIYCCAEAIPILGTHCTQIERVFTVRADHPYKSNIYYPGNSWTLPSGMQCRCADDGFTECHDPKMCFGHALGEVFCTGQGEEFAMECSFPDLTERKPPGAFVAMGKINTYHAPECSVCLFSGCITWNGQWSSWGSWSQCTAGCGGGFRRRNRHCPDVVRCFGESTEEGECLVKPCTDQSVPPDQWSRDMLEWHNYFRRGHDSPAVVWDRSLATAAQKYADHLNSIKATTIVHSPQGWTSDGKIYRYRGVAEMIAYKTKIDARPPQYYMTGKDAARGYYAEVRYYDWKSPGRKLEHYAGSYVVAHFTQLLWKSTDRMGCGVARSDEPIDDGMYVYFSVCHYEPGGNDAIATEEWEEQVPCFNDELICQAECGPNKCFSFTGVHTNSTSTSSCKCTDSVSPTCSTPCLAFCPGVEWNEMCYGENECHCTSKAAVCDGLPVVE